MIKITVATLTAAAFLLSLQSTRAGSATWKRNPTSGDWNTAGNWTPPSVPNGPDDVATFATSNKVSVSPSAHTEVNEIIFNPSASAYTISSNPAGLLTISGRGITNDSGITQQFIVEDCPDCFSDSTSMTFTNAAIAGTGTAFTVLGRDGESGLGGKITFQVDASAGSASFEIFGGRGDDRAYNGAVIFYDNATADHGTFLVHSGRGYEGYLAFLTNATAGNATVTNAGGFVYFWQTSNAGNSVIANDGYLVFRDGASARCSDHR